MASKINNSDTILFGDSIQIELSTTGTPNSIHTLGKTNQQLQKQTSSSPITLSAAEFKLMDRCAVTSSKNSSTTPNRLLKLQRRSENKLKNIEQIRQNVVRKVQEYNELTEVIRNAKKRKGGLYDSVQNVNQVLKKPGMDIPRSMITRLMFQPDDYITRYNYPKCLDEFTTNLYKCSPDAYKLIQETFGNVLPQHSKI